MARKHPLYSDLMPFTVHVTTPATTGYRKFVESGVVIEVSHLLGGALTTGKPVPFYTHAPVSACTFDCRVFMMTTTMAR